jgi:trigger factor
MQVTETTEGQGLKREFTIVVPATEIEAKVSSRLSDLASTVQLPGFRPGKVPLALVKRRYGDGVMGEVVQEAVNEATQRVISDRGLRPVLSPKVELKSFEPGKDLEYGLAVEVMPEIPSVDLGALAFSRLKVEVDEPELETGLGRLAEQNRAFEKPAKARAAAKTGFQLGLIDLDLEPAES